MNYQVIFKIVCLSDSARPCERNVLFALINVYMYIFYNDLLATYEPA